MARFAAAVAAVAAVTAVTAAALAMAACGAGGAPPADEPPASEPPADDLPGNGPPARVIVVSVDGLVPASYMDPDAHDLRVPTLRMMRAGGAYSPGVESVYPTVTYPSHTSMVTGVRPGVHGITSNRIMDPMMRNQSGWYWYEEDIRVPTIWQVAAQAGLHTALVNWPVTVGARADWLLPEYWRAGTADDVKLARALSTPGLMEAVAAEFPDFWANFTPPDVLDKASIDVAIHLIRNDPPGLMLVHTWMVDEFQHRNGLWSAEGNARIEEADTQLGRLIEEVEAAGLWDETILVVLSDHGFLPVDARLRPGVALARAGLVTLDGDTITDLRAHVRVSSAQAYIYVVDEADEEAKALVLDIYTTMAATEGSGVGAVYSRAQIRERGGDDAAFLSIEPAPGYSFSSGYTGDEVVATPGKGDHGHDPATPGMEASLLIYGPRVQPGAIEGARLIDVAPTIAAWLGVPLPDAEGRALPVTIE